MDDNAGNIFMLGNSVSWVILEKHLQVCQENQEMILDTDKQNILLI
ncbi:MAG: hypothetical protein PHH71_04275 [Clostridia bacterium]|nr:hypothetical protein [Clostridia bacterium]